MGRNPCCAKEGLNKGAWTAIEDQILIDYIKIHGEGKWRDLPKRAGLKRCGKSCRLRWLNYLRPDIKRGNITRDEEDLIIRLHNLLGNRWSLIAGRLPGRTDNEIKNYWNTNIGKKLQNGNFKSSTTSSGGRSSSSSAGQDPNHETPPDMGPCVVYTQATRCTNIIVSKDRAQQPEPLMVAAPSVTPESETSSPSLSLPHLHYKEDNNNPLSNFMEGFEMDESFFSDLLTMDIAEPSCFENKVEDSNASPSEAGYNNLLLSPKSEDATHLLSDDNSLHGSEDFQSMLALMESELDWL